MTRSLPAQPDLGHLKRQAKNLLKAHQRGDANTCRVLRQLRRFSHGSDADILTSEVRLNEAQFALALDYGFSSWNALSHHVEGISSDAALNAHELLCKTNWELIKGKSFSAKERADISTALLASICKRAAPEAPAPSFTMYPLFFSQSYSSRRRLITINGVMPKTQIFSANHHELEILRLLALWKSENQAVQDMLVETKERLARRTCFGRFCAKGECFEASIAALRFLSVAFPEEEEWISMLVENVGREIDNKPRGRKRHSGIVFYYWLTLTDIQMPIAVSEIRRYESQLVHVLSRSNSYSNDHDRLYNPIAMYIARNCLARLSEYQQIKETEGYVGGDGRFHFDLVARG